MDSATLFWNDVALEANKEDHSHGPKEAGGPVYSARALAMVHAAMADAFTNAHRANGGSSPFAAAFVSAIPPGLALPAAALGGAAHAVLSAIHTWQRPAFEAKRLAFLASLATEDPQAVADGWNFGVGIGNALLEQRRTDGSEDATNGNAASRYVPGGLNGMHGPDPLNPNQGFYGWHWGNVTPFVLGRHEVLEFLPGPPPRPYEKRYLDDYAEVLARGEKGAARTQEQTDIGVFWAYDGVNRIGTPPRLYNRIVVAIGLAETTPLTEAEWVALLARCNLAMSDAGIVAWQAKYLYNVWRPVLGVREHIEIPGRPDAPKVPDWVPLGAPNSNGGAKDFTPPFPAYPSGHSTFGAACFTVLQRFRSDRTGGDGDAINLTFTSEEVNGVTLETDGVTVRPDRPQTFTSIEAMIDANLESRVVLGVHWRFDGDGGKDSGVKVGLKVASSAYCTT